MRKRRVRNLFLICLAGIGGLLILLFAFANLPFSQRFLTNQLNRILAGSELPLHVGSIKKVLPNSVKVLDVNITGIGGEPTIYAGDVRAKCRIPALFRKRVVLKGIKIDQAFVNLSMNMQTGRYNVAEIFVPVKKGAAAPGNKKATWDVFIKDADLTGIRFRMRDSITGIHINQDVAQIRIKNFNILISESEIQARIIGLNEAEGSLVLTPRLKPGESLAKDPWNFGLANAELDNINFTFHHPADSLKVDVVIDHGRIMIRQMDIVEKVLDVRKIYLSQASARILHTSPTRNHEEQPLFFMAHPTWYLAANAVEVKGCNVGLGEYRNPTQPESGDQYTLSGFGANIRDFRFAEGDAGITVQNMSFEMENGFSLEKMKGKIEANNKTTRLDLSVTTGNSLFNLAGEADRGLPILISQPVEIQNGSLDLRNTRISAIDVSCFFPELADHPFYTLASQSPMDIRGSLVYEERALTVSGFSLSQDRNFNITMEAYTEDLLQITDAEGNLDLDLTGVDQDWVAKLLEDFALGDTLPVLAGLEVHGSLSNREGSSNFDIDLLSSQGNIEVQGSLDLKAANYVLESSFMNVDLGRLFHIPELGTFTGKGVVRGMGYKPENFQAAFSLQVDTLGFREYSYGNTSLEGMLSPGEIGFHFLAEDSSLHADLDLSLNPGDSLLNITANGHIKASLNELHLYGDSLSVQSGIAASLSKTASSLEADVLLQQLGVTSSSDAAQIQQMTASVYLDSVNTLLEAEGDFFRVNMQVSKPLDEIGSMAQDVRNYFNTFIDTTRTRAETRISRLPEISGSGTINHHKSLDVILRDTGFHFNSVGFTLENRSSANRMYCTLNGQGMAYRIARTGQISASISDSAGVLDLSFIADKTSLMTGPLYRWELEGRFTNRTSLTGLSILDNQELIVYGIEIAGKVDSNLIDLDIPSRQLIMNREPWSMDSPDLLTFDLATKKSYPSLKIFSDSSFLGINTSEQEGLLTYKLFLNSVEYESLFRKELFPGMPEGIISGSVDYGLAINGAKEIGADLQVNQVHYSGLEFNRLNLDGSLSLGQKETYNLDVHVQLDSSTIGVKGEKSERGTRDLSAELSSFPVKLIQPFASSYISDLDGLLNGNINISNQTGREQFHGQLGFRNATLKVNALNAPFRIADQQILFEGQKLILRNFRVLDTLNNSMTVDGHIDFGNRKEIMADLDIASSELQVMSRKESTNATFSGNVFVDSKFSVRGPLNNPAIDGKIRLTHGTEVYYRHAEDLSLSHSEKIVSFASQTQEGATVHSPTLERQLSFMRSSVETIVEIDPTTFINFSLSKRVFNLDLNIKGGGSAKYNMLKNRQMALSGTYYISEGDAILKLTGWPNKTFRITDEGYIRWDGIIEDPELRFEAINRVRSSYINPVDEKIRDVDFNVILQFSGPLSDLDILFTIHTPDQYIMSMINTMSPEEKMRQAISILLFETIDLPGVSSSSDYITQQMNQILSSQLNQLTKTTIKGIDISFGIDSYNQPDQAGGETTKTNLSYEVRKSLLNNRAQIELSGRVYDVDKQPGSSDIALQNISFEYRLDSAATKYLKVYNEQTYDDVFEGEVIKTGVGFNFRKRYGSFGQIWKREK